MTDFTLAALADLAEGIKDVVVPLGRVAQVCLTLRRQWRMTRTAVEGPTTARKPQTMPPPVTDQPPTDGPEGRAGQPCSPARPRARRRVR